MSIKRKKLSVGDLVIYTRNSHDYPKGVDMGIGIITSIDGRVTVYWPRLWGRDATGLAQHWSRDLKKLVIRENGWRTA